MDERSGLIDECMHGRAQGFRQRGGKYNTVPYVNLPFVFGNDVGVVDVLALSHTRCCYQRSDVIVVWT